MINKLVPGSKHRNLTAIMIILAVSLFIEIVICNANAFRVKNNGQYEQKTYGIADLGISGADVNINDNEIIYRKDYGASVFIELNDIDTKIGTVYMDLEIPDPVLKYVVAYTDEANESYYRSFEREFVSGVYKTKWFTCHLNGKSNCLIIRLDNLEDGYTFRINQIQINKPVPMDISMVRLAVIFALILLIYGLRRMAFFRASVKTRYHNMLLCLVSFVFVLTAIVFYNNSYSKVNLQLMYNVDLVDALINGQLNLDIDVSDELKALSNPYDTSVRETQGVEYSWDTAYYNGKYYCYFGVIPIALFFVPYKLLTGTYLQCNIVVIITYCLYIFLLDFLFIKIIRHCVPKALFGIELLGMILLNSAVHLFLYAAEPTFYLVPYSVGLLFIAIGFFFFTTWYFGKRTNAFLIFMGAVFLALAVGCRPPLLVYTFIIIPFGIKVIKEKKKDCIRDVVALMLPYIVIGGILAAYNYLRFENIMEFGTTYQLTAQDEVHNTHTLYEVPTLLWLGLFQPLNFKAVFPFVAPGEPVYNFAGSFYTGNLIIPLFSTVPFLLSIFSPMMWKSWRKNKDPFSSGTLVFAAATGLLITILEFVMAGVEWRYTAEAAPLLCIVAILLVADFLSERSAEIMTAGMTLIFLFALYSFFVSLFMGIAGDQEYMLAYHPEFYYSIERLCCFWK